MTGGLLEQGLTRGTTAGQVPPRGPVRRRSRRVLGDFNTALWASSAVLEDPDKTRVIVQMQKDAAEHLTPGGENDPQVWKDLLVTQFGYSEPVYEAVLENVGAEWRFDKAREDQVRGAGRLLVEQGGIAKEPDYEQLFAREHWDV